MILEEEGLEAVWQRHAVLAGAVWAAVEAWGQGGSFRLNIGEPAIRSHAVTTIRTAPGEGSRLRRWCADAAGVTLGVGLPAPGIDPEGLFRIGHMGHLNPPTLLGTLATVEAGLRALAIPHGPGALEAAAAVVAAAELRGRVNDVAVPAEIR
jgi:alanine-glyoxylate transaminase/serine-glyoxylate transaminase/serine-pyruvate transaminase